VAVALAGASLLGAILPVGAPWGVVAACSAVALVAVADWALTVSPASVGVTRSWPESVELGKRAPLAWTVTNPTRRALHVAFADELAPTLRAGARRFHVTIPAAGTADVATEVQPSRRGQFVPTEVVVRVDGRLRLMARQRARSDPGRLKVLPPFRSRREAELRIRRARTLEVGQRSTRARGGGTEFDQLLDYGVDDESRRIDWAASARVARPIVRTFRAERNQQVLMLVDSGRTMAGRVEAVPRLEHAIDAVLAITAVATGLGDRVGLLAFDRGIRAVVAPGSGSGQFARVVDAVYWLEPELYESDYRTAFSEALTRFGRRALLVVLTELAEQAAEDGLLRDVPVLARTHLVIVAAVRDPDVEAWARTLPGSAEDTYRKAAALTALTRRRALARRLGALGVTVIAASPGDLAPRLADAYVHVKATGRL